MHFSELKSILRNNNPAFSSGDISIHTEILQHAFLQTLGAIHLPEISRFSCRPEHHTIEISICLHHSLSHQAFIKQIDHQAKLYNIQILFMVLHPFQTKWIFLKIPSHQFTALLPAVLSRIHGILKDPSKYLFYSEWTSALKKYSFDSLSLGVSCIEDHMRDININLSPDWIWKYLLKYFCQETPKEIQIIPCTDIKEWQWIELHYLSSGGKQKFKLLRTTVLDFLAQKAAEIKTLKNCEQAVIAPTDIFVILRAKGHAIYRDTGENYYLIAPNTMKCVYDFLIRQGIDIKPFYKNLTENKDFTIYFLSKKDALRGFLLIKEFLQFPCPQERFHQLKYYFDHKSWNDLSECLISLYVDCWNHSGIDYSLLLLWLSAYGKPTHPFLMPLLEPLLEDAQERKGYFSHFFTEANKLILQIKTIEPSNTR